MRLDLIDAVVVGIYVALVVAIGLAVSRGQRGATDYMLGGRALPWGAILLSIVATETSTVTFLSVPGFAWARDLTFLQLAAGYVLGRLVVVWLLLPRYFERELFTAYDLLYHRFGAGVRTVASALFLAMRTLADGLRLFLTAIVVEEVFGIGLELAILVTGCATILYTFFGGIRAVIWTDVIQFGVYMLGAVVAFLLLLRGLDGGFATVLAQTGKLTAIDARWVLDDAFVLPAGLVGGAFVSLGTHGADQMLVQRYLCARSRADAARALAWSGVVVFAQFALFLLIGVGLYCWYTQHPPATPFVRPDRVFAAFLVDELPAGVLGLVLGGVFAAAMSTLSSSLNSCATSAVQDLYRPLLAPAASERHLLLVARLCTVGFGLLQITVGIAGQQLPGSVIERVMEIASFTTGIVLGIFFLSLLPWRVTQFAAFVALLGGCAGMLALRLTTDLAWPWFACFGSLGTCLLGILAQIAWPRAR